MQNLYQVSLVNVIPTYACNIACEHCFLAHKRHNINPAVLSEDKILEIFSIIAEEGASENLQVEWYGGEVSILGSQYLRQCIQSVKSIFPKSTHSVVSNLINIDNEWLDVIYENCTHLCTSYEGIRFNDGDELYKIWESNIEKAIKNIPVDCITVANPYFFKSLDVISRFPFNFITVLRMMIPEDMPMKQKRKILQYTTSIDDYVKMCIEAIKLLGTERVTQAIQTKNSILNVIHIFPDGSVGLPGPSKLGYPYEKNYIFYKPDSKEKSILRSKERIKFIASQSLMCPADCNKKCLAEFKYPWVCMGYLQ